MATTFAGEEIARVGTFKLSSGEHTFTAKQFAAAVSNAQGQAPVIGIGHTDPRFAVAAAEDGDPSFGYVDNLRIDGEGDAARLLGDLHMADWLAAAAPLSFRRRSLEGAVDGDDLRITAIKLLGTTRPGIHTLADLRTAVSDEGPALVAASGAADGGKIVTAFLEAPKPLAASLDLDSVRQSYYDGLPPMQREQWWVRSVVVDDDGALALIVCGEPGKLYRVPFTVKGTDVEFGEPAEVVENFVPVAASSRAPSTLAVWASQAESRPDEKETTMDVDKTILVKRLGLAEDATDDQITEALAAEEKPDELAAAQARATELEAERDAAKAEAEAAKSRQAPEGSVQIESDVLQKLKDDAAAGVAAREQQQSEHREAVLAAALTEGRISASRADHFRTMWTADQEGTEKLLTASAEDGGLAPGLVPVSEHGTAVEASGEKDGDGIDAFFDNVFPATRTED